MKTIKAAAKTNAFKVGDKVEKDEYMCTWPFNNTTLELVKDKKSSGEIKDLVNDFIKAIEKKSVLDGKVDLEYVIAYMQAFMTRQAIIKPSIALDIERDIENIK